jgi:hypothetical protein
MRSVNRIFLGAFSLRPRDFFVDTPAWSQRDDMDRSATMVNDENDSESADPIAEEAGEILLEGLAGVGAFSDCAQRIADRTLA